ncbi:MAG: Wzz/FepE/Etk N-terminal domain-containing protein [Bacteroidota bacterium]
MNNASLEIKTFIQLLLSRKKTFLILIILTAVISIIVSYIIPPKYKTIAVVYPVHLAPYSEESQTEQLLQYYNSVAVRDIVIKKMRLIEHYKIDTTKSDYRSLLNYLYRENISFSPTLYESIEIEVKDKDPLMTKAIAECIIQTTDSFILTLKKKQIVEEYSNYKNEIDLIQNRIDSLNNLIVSIQSEFNILDANYQAKYLSKKLTSGKLDAESQKIAEAIKTKRDKIKSMRKIVKEQIISLGNLKREVDRLEVDLKGDLHFSQVISPPYVPDKKYFPVRWIIVALSELAVICVFIIYLLYSQKK